MKRTARPMRCVSSSADDGTSPSSSRRTPKKETPSPHSFASAIMMRGAPAPPRLKAHSAQRHGSLGSAASSCGAPSSGSSVASARSAAVRAAG